MCAAHDEIDQISEAEKAARQRIEDAEKQSRLIRQESDKEAKALIAKAEHDAKMKATKMLSDIEGKKTEVQAKILSQTEKYIKDLEKQAGSRKRNAQEAVLMMILGEE